MKFGATIITIAVCLFVIGTKYAFAQTSDAMTCTAGQMGMDLANGSVTWNASINKSTVAPGETITVSGSSNGSISRLTYQFFGGLAVQLPYPSWTQLFGGVGNTSGSRTFTVDPTPGSHNIVLSACLGNNCMPGGTTAGFCGYTQLYYTTVLSVPIPGTPTGLSATAGACGTNSINLSWDLMTGATSYKLYRNGVFDKSVNPPSSGTVVTATDSGLTVGQLYQYQVSALNASGESAKSASVSQNAPNLCPPVNNFIDIGLRVNQGTPANPDIQHIAIESITTPPPTPSKLRIAKNGTAYNTNIFHIALVDPGDVNATRVRVKLADGSIKALRSCTVSNGCQYVP